MFDLNTIPPAIDYIKNCYNLKQRHDKFLEDLANVEKDEQIIGLRNIILEKDRAINKLIEELGAVKKNQEFERKKLDFKFIEDTGLYEDKDGNKFCSKCILEKHQFCQVRNLGTKRTDEVECVVCKELYFSAAARRERKAQEERNAKRYRPGLGNFSRQ